MAHTPKGDDTRSHPELIPIGTKVGMYRGDELMRGKVTSHDEGGWIYFEWEKYFPGAPGWGRSTNVLVLED